MARAAWWRRLAGRPLKHVHHSIAPVLQLIGQSYLASPSRLLQPSLEVAAEQISRTKYAADAGGNRDLKLPPYPQWATSQLARRLEAVQARDLISIPNAIGSTVAFFGCHLHIQYVITARPFASVQHRRPLRSRDPGKH